MFDSVDRSLILHTDQPNSRGIPMVWRVNVQNWSVRRGSFSKGSQTLAEKKEGVAGGIQIGQQREQSNKQQQ